jgi:hypothetical protein
MCNLSPPGKISQETFDREMTNTAIKQVVKKEGANASAFSLWLFSRKVDWLLFKINAESFINKKLHCNRGYHRLTSHKIDVHNSKGTKLSTAYLECHICNRLFFPSERLKRNYLRIKDQEVSNFNRVFGINLKRKKGVKELG